MGNCQAGKMVVQTFSTLPWQFFRFLGTAVGLHGAVSYDWKVNEREQIHVFWKW
jgi:hypothetical protein